MARSRIKKSWREQRCKAFILYIEACAAEMDRSYYKNAWWAATKEGLLRRTSIWETLPMWPWETKKKKKKKKKKKTSKSLPEGFQHTTKNPGNRLHRIEQNGLDLNAIVSIGPSLCSVTEGERRGNGMPPQKALKQRASAKRNESAKSAKPETRDHHRCRQFRNWRAVFATDSFERKFA